MYIYIDIYIIYYQDLPPVSICTIGSVISLSINKYIQNIDLTPAANRDLHYHNQIFSDYRTTLQVEAKCPHKTKGYCTNMLH